jgi:cysteine synthase B
VFASIKTLFSSKNFECHVSRIEQAKKVVGNTPLAHIDTINGTNIFAKLEYFNPFSYSVKDRAAAYMLTGPLERGEIDPSRDFIWIEASSGNLGIAYGKIGKYLGLETMIVTPSIVGETTFRRVKASVTNCEKTPGGYCPRGERDGALKKVVDMWIDNPDKYIWRDQYTTEDNIRAHQETTGPEIWKETEGKITALVVGTGTGGTIIGTGIYLKEQNQNIEIVGAQPQVNHHIQGLRNFSESMKSSIIKRNEDLIDNWIEISDKEAFEHTKELWRRGYPVGTSSGLNYAAARKTAKKGINGAITTLFPDTFINSFKIMENYLITGKIKDS